MKKRVTLALGAMLFFALAASHAQNTAKITGSVLDAEGKPVSYANVVLYALPDSAMVKAEISDDRGIFELHYLSEGQYFINIRFVGLPELNSNVLQLQTGQILALPAFRMQPASNDLSEVLVKAQKPLVEVKPDKTVFNVEGSINAQGNNAMELLRKSPGVVVDNNDNIMLQGKSGVRVYIDGKPSPLGTADLAAYLQTLQSTDIEAIEIITNPSSRYDAQGNAGIINIRLKKDKRLGTNGNVDLGYSVGRLPQYNGKISGNYRDKNINVFGSYGFSQGMNWNFFNLYREQIGQSFDQRSISSGDWNNHSFRLGADLSIGKEHTLGFLANGNVNNFLWKSASNTGISSLGSSALDSLLIARSENDGNRDNYNFNINYRFDNSKGLTWNIDADYGLFENIGDEFQPNFYTDPTGTEIFDERIYANETPTDINIYTFKVDHERPLLGGQLGAGVKFALVRTDNTFDFFNVIGGERQLDIDRSNRFKYDENVNAAYLNYSRKLSEKFNVQAGVRMEQTNSEGDLIAMKPTDNQNVERSYLDLFPSAGITFQVNPQNSLALTYSRRIDRPSYQDLNPFQNRLDELTFEQGNPFLNPQYSNNFQLTHTFKYRYNTTLSYSRTTDLITRITDTAGVNASFITWLNLASQENISLTFSAPVQITKWWDSFVNLTGHHTHNTADYGDGKVVDLRATAFNIYAQQTFSLPWDVKFEVSGWYASPGLWGGTFEMDDMGSMDLGVQKKILNGRGNLKVSVSDVLLTNRWSGTSQFGALFMNVGGGWDSRRFRVNLSYRFGNDQVKAARRRSTGLEDEQKRIKSDD